ncbi:MAG TPA: carbohydrate ABC transporter permease [Ktedonobacteraceae bacterium]|jgi:multiple sugar transport system permease protein|nr:carbohydrate ABC transporter permease [Ktedonobacteraceae bacterium]
MKLYRVEPTPIRWQNLLLHLCLVAGALLMLYPLIWMLAASFKPEDLILSDPGLWPKQFTLQNYIEGWTALGVTFGTFFWNSFLVSTGSVIGNVLTCSMAAYAFARLKVQLRTFWFAVMLCSIMLPYHAIVVPQFLLFKQLGWVNTYLPLIVPKFLATDAFFIFLIVQFIRTLPRELDEAAKIDGCGSIQFFWRIIIPLILPALAATAIFTFIWAWSDFFGQLIFLNDPKIYTLPIALRTFLDGTGTSHYGQLFAMSIFSLVPIFILFLVCQRLLIQGISTSGLKG